MRRFAARRLYGRDRLFLHPGRLVLWFSSWQPRCFAGNRGNHRPSSSLCICLNGLGFGAEGLYKGLARYWRWLKWAFLVNFPGKDDDTNSHRTQLPPGVYEVSAFSLKAPILHLIGADRYQWSQHEGYEQEPREGIFACPIKMLGGQLFLQHLNKALSPKPQKLTLSQKW